MNIAIIGAGAMGCIYGGYLADGGNNVYLVDLWEEHVDKINQNGLLIYEGSEEHIAYPQATTEPSSIGTQMDLMIIFVKSYHTLKAVRGAQELIGPKTKVLTLQNGIGNIDTISEVVPKHCILAGTTSHGANVKGPGEINHAGSGKTTIGRIDGESSDERAEEIRKTLNDAGLETVYEQNIEGVIWDKLMVNVGINALTAILEIKNGELLENEEANSLLGLLVDEAREVALESGVDLNIEDPVEYVRSIAKATANNKSSMYQDILNGRKTEIDYINGGLVREGEKLGLSVSYNKFASLMIKAKERIGGDS